MVTKCLVAYRLASVKARHGWCSGKVTNVSYLSSWMSFSTCCYAHLAFYIDSSGRPMFHVDHSTSTQCSWLWSRLMWFTALWINILIKCNLLQVHKVRMEFTAKLHSKIETRCVPKKWPLRVLLLCHQGPEHMPWSICPGCTGAYKAYYATLISRPSWFSHSQFRHQAPPRPYDMRDPSSKSRTCGRECRHRCVLPTWYQAELCRRGSIENIRFWKFWKSNFASYLHPWD